MSDEGKPGYKVAADGHTYHKSATANATTAPTNEATTQNAAKTKGLTSAQSEFVTIIDYEWHLKGDIDAESIKKEYGFTPDEWVSLQNDTTVHAALQERGINVKAVAPDSDIALAAGRSKLTPIQLICANSMLDLGDTRPIKKKLADLQVSSYQYQSWMKDPEFKHYMQERAEGILTDVSHEAMLSLIDRVMSGDLPAIKYYHELTGRFVSQAAVGTGGGGSQHDLQNMIVRIIEIIVDEVDDAQTAIRISDRLKGLIMGQQVASALSNPEIVQPEIAQARELTDKGKEMLARGVGVND